MSARIIRLELFMRMWNCLIWARLGFKYADSGGGAGQPPYDLTDF